MSMIFDGFASMEQAEAFVAAVKQQYGLDGQTFADEAEAMEHDPFPWRLDPPIVHVDRMPVDSHIASKVESAVGDYVGEFGSVYAGT